MKTIASTCAAIGMAALAIAGCGASDEEQIRAVAKEFLRLDVQENAERVCELMTPRAEAQSTAIVGGGECVRALRKTESSDDPPPSPAAVDKASLKLRDDRAVLVLEGRGMGLRKVDGDWRLDNMFNPSLDERPRRLDPRLATGSDEQQVRATLKALSAAYAKRDYQRACDLYGWGAEVMLFMGLAFASIMDTAASDKAPDDLSCVWVHREVSRIAGDDDLFAGNAIPATRIDAAKVSIRGDRATVPIAGEDTQRLIRQEGHWLMDVEAPLFEEAESPSPRSVEQCLRRSGAAIASGARDLRWATRRTAKAIAVRSGLVSVKGEGWRVFYTLPRGGDDPGLGAILANPGIVGTVAYVEDAAAQPGVVNRARSCGS